MSLIHVVCVETAETSRPAYQFWIRNTLERYAPSQSFKFHYGSLREDVPEPWQVRSPRLFINPQFRFLEACNPNFMPGERVLYIDAATTIIGDISDILADPTPVAHAGIGFISFQGGKLRELYEHAGDILRGRSNKKRHIDPDFTPPHKYLERGLERLSKSEVVDLRTKYAGAFASYDDWADPTKPTAGVRIIQHTDKPPHVAGWDAVRMQGA